MLKQFGPSTAVALLLGGAIAVALFIPVAAGRYRRTGRLRFVDVVTLLLVAVYFVALWSYTLVPFPAAEGLRCAGVQLHPFAFIGDIRADPRPLLHNRALLQVLFNVLLFMPLGFFLRVLARRGWALTTVIGFGISAVIEFTQLTGVWGMYRCAYRVFDVDDLMLNTSGAALGWLAAVPVAVLSENRRPTPHATRVTLGRRLVGVGVDVLASYLLGALLVLAWRAIELYGLGWDLDDLVTWPELLLAGVMPALGEAAWVLGRGQTFGEAAVGLESVVTTGNVTAARVVKYFSGVGGYLILNGVVSIPLGLTTFVLLSLGMIVWTRDHRGLSHALAGMELRVHTPGPVGLDNSVST
ncbi:MAG: VanZ family protein [Propionibacteriales bacterium]|nr:VanZ family protein [Propionibacteriales bacterium]